ncbi:MAG TPA: hypothetical protein VG347_05610 [Verrucomicrobiae bacterium]|nr:hypothetical protein [Verrucomicrobiae bacterium]
MNTTQVSDITDNLSTALVTAGNIAEVIAPQYAAFIVLGIAVAKALPDLERDVLALVNQTAPTAADIQLLAQKITALANPETL